MKIFRLKLYFPLDKGPKVHDSMCIHHFYKMYFVEVVCKANVCFLKPIQHVFCSLSLSLTGEYVSVLPAVVSTDVFSLSVSAMDSLAWNDLFMIYFLSDVRFLCELKSDFLLFVFLKKVCSEGSWLYAVVFT